MCYEGHCVDRPHISQPLWLPSFGFHQPPLSEVVISLWRGNAALRAKCLPTMPPHHSLVPRPFFRKGVKEKKRAWYPLFAHASMNNVIAMPMTQWLTSKLFVTSFLLQVNFDYETQPVETINTETAALVSNSLSRSKYTARIVSPDTNTQLESCKSLGPRNRWQRYRSHKLLCCCVLFYVEETLNKSSGRARACEVAI